MDDYRSSGDNQEKVNKLTAENDQTKVDRELTETPRAVTKARGDNTFSVTEKERVVKHRTYEDRLNDNFNHIRPRNEDFIEVYTLDDMRLDDELVAKRKAKEEQPENKKKPSRRLELLMLDLMEIEDWFSEDTNYDGDCLYINSTPTTEADDRFSHVDMVCNFANRLTGEDPETGEYKAFPFAVDITCTTNEAKLLQKMSWRHEFGRAANAPRNVSEYELHGEQKEGTGLLGVASVKYFCDKNEGGGYNERTGEVDQEGMRIPIGRIEMMPKLVLGVDSRLVEELVKGKPDEKYRDDYGDQAYEKAYQNFQIASRKVKWCILLEGKQQSRLQYEMLMGLRGKTGIDEATLEQAIENARVMTHYFNNAIKVANEQADVEIDNLPVVLNESGLHAQKRMVAEVKAERWARKYAQNDDEVCARIMTIAPQVYGE